MFVQKIEVFLRKITIQTQWKIGFSHAVENRLGFGQYYSFVQCELFFPLYTCQLWKLTSPIFGFLPYVQNLACPRFPTHDRWKFIITYVWCLRRITFLVACTRLYNPLCRSVRPSVGPSVRHTLLFFTITSILRSF